ncbi:predicted phage protein [Salmonella enterica subsp. enterica serovar Enteritidis str. P125109]|uniref:Predicted phage protein n=1 Tax=Salmonella enteritidis PT4 (strain P125109) TaxID=550537 RepID=A0A6C7HPS4_SALEP|nr:hypothetical protein [Salmonella enterica]AHU92027.1 hypothetical protein AU17_07125 [Salmonella enterica subsp. enterica serovar Enteritidis str. EC20110354]CAR32967.1 predicted phage protein [Salmonella enterica subsp. enterica serovar Enteritidis str. P125109]
MSGGNVKKLKDLLELDEDGLYAVRVKNGEISFCTLIPDDHLILSVEAFIDYLIRLGFTVSY